MNTDELLVQLDFDETNVNHQSPQSQQQQAQQQQPHISSVDSFKRAHLQRPSSPPLNTSEPILTNFLLPDGDNKSADALNTHHHRRAFSDDNALATAVTQTQPKSPHSSNLIQSTGEKHSLINLSRSHSSVEGDNDDDDDQSIGHLEPTTKILSTANGDGPSQSLHHTADDTIEVSLLADLSMDSRESQPLLGIGRDTHDFVYNNFPGKNPVLLWVSRFRPVFSDEFSVFEEWRRISYENSSKCEFIARKSSLSLQSNSKSSQANVIELP